MDQRDLVGYEVAYDETAWDDLSRVIVIVEDHEIVRSGIRRMIGEMVAPGWLEVVEASTLDEAKVIVEERKGKIDLVLLDVNLPDANGIDEVKCLQSDWRSVPVVIISACEDWKLAAQFLKAGVLGFIPKSSNVNVMENALKLILAGGRYFPPQVFDVFTAITSSSSKVTGGLGAQRDEVNSASAVELSPRQREVLELMLRGRSNKEIARELGVSVGTAKNYVAVVLRAYNATSRAKAILAALNGGLPEHHE